jgi:hypothetical protein
VLKFPFKDTSRGVFWWRNVGENDNLEDLDVDVAIILKLISNKWVRQARTG